MTEEGDLIHVRRKKLEGLLAAGDIPYKSSFKRTHSISQIIDKHSGIEPSTHTGESVTIAGRLMAMRRHGKASFAEIVDATGKIQLYLAVDILSEDLYEKFLSFDIGDFAGVTGEVFKTKRGELSVQVSKFEVLSKSLRPLPEK